MDYDSLRDASLKPYRFGKIEIRDLLISILVLTLAFMLMFRNTDFVTAFFKDRMGSLWPIGLFILMVAIVIMSFVFHELGHKFTAQKFGLWSEYRMFPIGLLVALIMAPMGFLFAAPGVTYISGYVNDEQDGKISLAGPLVNIILSVIGLAGCFAFDGNPIIILFYLMFILNASLAVFNLLPIGILDGSKILRWDSTIWLVCIVIAGLLFVSRMIGLVPSFGYNL